MAGDWIKMRSDLIEDPAVIDMARKLSLDEFAVVGRLQCLWAWADSQSRDGHAAGVTAMWVNRKVQRDGFAEAMVSVKWLSISEDGITFLKFDNHNGATAKSRALGTNRKQKSRSKDDCHDGVPLSVTPPSRSERDRSVTREEKRREELTSKTKAPAAPSFDPKSALIELGVAEQVVIDWLDLRKKKKAGATKTAIDVMIREAGKAGMPLESALAQCCQRGWAGLNADWLRPDTRASPGSSGKFDPTAHVNRNRPAQ